LRKEIAALDSLQRELHADHYSDGRTIPRAGAKVYAYVAGMFGGDAILEGTVTRRSSGLAVRVKEGISHLGGRQALGRARVYPLSSGWTVVGEEHPVQRAQRQVTEAGKAYQRGCIERNAALAEAARASKTAGTVHLDAVSPQIGMRVRSLRDDRRGTIREIDTEGCVYAQMDGDMHAGYVGENLSEWIAE